MAGETTLAGLVARSQGGDENSQDKAVNFDQDATSKTPAIDTSKDAGITFKGGNYDLKDHKELFQAMEVMGQQVLDQAKKEGVDLSKLPEFKNIDLHLEAGSKDITAKDVGAVLLASSFGNSNGPMTNQASSDFEDTLPKRQMDALLEPSHAAAVKEIAKALLEQNGVQVVHPNTPEQVVAAIGNDDTSSRMRC